MDFAFMFIPSEAIYYDLLINKIGAVADDARNLIARKNFQNLTPYFLFENIIHLVLIVYAYKADLQS